MRACMQLVSLQGMQQRSAGVHAGGIMLSNAHQAASRSREVPAALPSCSLLGGSLFQELADRTGLSLATWPACMRRACSCFCKLTRIQAGARPFQSLPQGSATVRPELPGEGVSAPYKLHTCISSRLPQARVQDCGGGTCRHPDLYDERLWF